MTELAAACFSPVTTVRLPIRSEVLYPTHVKSPSCEINLSSDSLGNFPCGYYALPAKDRIGQKAER
jgi:hypothetical protein